MPRIIFLIILLCAFLTLAWGAASAQNWNIDEVTYFPYWLSASKIIHSNDYVFVNSGYGGIRIVEVSNPIDPMEVAFIDESTWYLDYAIDSALLYKTGYAGEEPDQLGEFEIFDITDPEHPLLLSTYTYNSALRIKRVEEGNGVAALILEEDGVILMDVSNPLQPDSVGYYDCALGVRGIFGGISENLLHLVTFVQYGLGALEIVDIDDPAAPLFLGSCYIPLSSSYEIIVDSDYVYTLSGEDLVTIDVSDPENPSIVNFTPVGYSVSLGLHEDILAVGLDDSLDVVLFDITNPAQPSSLGSAVLPGSALDVDLDGEYIYTASGSKGLRILDGSDPVTIEEVSSFSSYGPVEDLAIDTDYAYLACGYLGMQIVSLSDPNLIIGELLPEIDEVYLDIAIADNYAFMLSNEDIWSIDISEPTQPELACNLPVSWISNTGEILISNSLALIASISFVILDISNPTNLVEIYNSPLSGTCIPRSIASVENLAILCGSIGQYPQTGVLKIIDFSDPFNPQELSQLDVSDVATDIVISGDFAYLAADDDGLVIVDISDPLNPIQAGCIPTETKAYGLALENQHLFLAALEGGILIFDVDNPVEPVLTGYYNTPGYAHSIETFNDWALVADYYYYGVYDCTQALPVENLSQNTLPATTTLYPAFPNPFNASTQITLTLPSDQNIDLSVYNLLGQNIATLVDGMQAAGTLTVQWDAVNVASGLYIYRLQTGEFCHSGKLIVMK